MDHKKRNISVRLSESDIRKIKDISNRLGVKDSELFRFGIKNMLMKLMPLGDANLSGADLIPTWLECGEDLLAFFDIDLEKLDEIFNPIDKDQDQKVDEGDLDLIMMSNFNKKYAVKKLSQVCGKHIDPIKVQDTLCTYLYEKYVLEKDCECSVIETKKSVSKIHEYNNVSSF